VPTSDEHPRPVNELPMSEQTMRLASKVDERCRESI
jgi:hypothetical protein